MKTIYKRLTLAEHEEISKGIYSREKNNHIAEKLCKQLKISGK